jgi:hypothetical protein
MWENLRNACVGGLVMLALAAPFVAAISIQQGRFTIGDSGVYNYRLSVSMANLGLGRESQLAAKLKAEKFNPEDMTFASPRYPYHFPQLTVLGGVCHDRSLGESRTSLVTALKIFLLNCRQTVHGKYWVPFFAVLSVTAAIGFWKQRRTLFSRRYVLLVLPLVAGWLAYALILSLPRYINAFALLFFLLLAPFIVSSINKKVVIAAFLFATVIAMLFQWQEIGESCCEVRRAQNVLSIAGKASEIGLGDFCAIRYKELFRTTGMESWVMYTDARCLTSVDNRVDGYLAMSDSEKAHFVRVLLDNNIRYILHIEPPSGIRQDNWVPLGFDRYCEKLKSGPTK